MKFSVKFSIFAFNKISAEAEPSTKSFASAYVAATASAAASQSPYLFVSFFKAVANLLQILYTHTQTHI